jgi:hypothetical protein
MLNGLNFPKTYGGNHDSSQYPGVRVSTNPWATGVLKIFCEGYVFQHDVLQQGHDEPLLCRVHRVPLCHFWCRNLELLGMIWFLRKKHTGKTSQPMSEEHWATRCDKPDLSSLARKQPLVSCHFVPRTKLEDLRKNPHLALM